MLFIFPDSAFASYLPIANSLEDRGADVVMVGWGHFYGNHTIPRLLIEEINKLKDETAKKTIFVREWPKGAPEVDFNLSHALGTSLEHGRDISEAAKKKGVTVVFGDHPDRWHRVVDREESDNHISDVAIQAVGHGQKVIILVGSLHGIGIARKLREANIRFVPMITVYNPLTGEVRWKRKILPRAIPDPQIIRKHPFADPEEGWIKIKQPDADYRHRFQTFAKWAVRNICTAILASPK